MGKHAEIARRFYDAFNGRDWDTVAALMNPQVEWFHAARAELVQGVDGVIALFKSSTEAFPDARIEVRAIHEAGDFVICECAFTRPRVSVTTQASFCEVGLLRDGRWVRGSTYADTLQLLLELECRNAA